MYFKPICSIVVYNTLLILLAQSSSSKSQIIDALRGYLIDRKMMRNEYNDMLIKGNLNLSNSLLDQLLQNNNNNPLTTTVQSQFTSDKKEISSSLIILSIGKNNIS